MASINDFLRISKQSPSPENSSVEESFQSVTLQVQKGNGNIGKRKQKNACSLAPKCLDMNSKQHKGFARVFISGKFLRQCIA